MFHFFIVLLFCYLIFYLGPWILIPFSPCVFALCFQSTLRFHTRCRQCKILCQRQFDIEDLPKTPCCHEGQLPCCTRDPCNPLLTSTNSDKEIGTLKDVTSSSISYGSVSPISQVSQETFDGLKDIEEMTLDEYFQGDRHQLSRHIILILFLSFFSILVSIYIKFSSVQ